MSTSDIDAMIRASRYWSDPPRSIRKSFVDFEHANRYDPERAERLCRLLGRAIYRALGRTKDKRQDNDLPVLLLGLDGTKHFLP